MGVSLSQSYENEIIFATAVLNSTKVDHLLHLIVTFLPKRINLVTTSDV